jgi:hypothetical protein
VCHWSFRQERVSGGIYAKRRYLRRKLTVKWDGAEVKPPKSCYSVTVDIQDLNVALQS